MKLAVTLTNKASIEPLIKAGSDIFVIGIDHLSHRMNTTFSVEEFITLVETIKRYDKEIYVNLNRIVHDEDLRLLEDTIKAIKTLPIDGIIYTDLAVFMLAEEFSLKERLIYAPETYSTHSYDLAFWSQEKIKSIVLSREVTLDEIEKISGKASLPIVFYGHGYINMFHSRRPLIENFFKHTGDEDSNEIVDRRNLTIVEEIRDEHYPIYQDEYGTHIFRAKPRESFSVLNRLKNVLDVFVIDSVLLDEKEFIEAVKNYRLALENKLGQDVIDDYKEAYDQGFYFKKTQSIKGETS